eukprot:scaffold417_cov184-Alexandrium_tamarense.AAC.14
MVGMAVNEHGRRAAFILVEGVKAAALHILCLVWLPPPSWCAATRLHWWPLGSVAAESAECFAAVFIGWRGY